jgi:heme-degrading monooxygenase HmoA
MKHARVLLIPALLLHAGCLPSQDLDAHSWEETMAASQPRIMLIVGGLKSNLSNEELERRYRERMPQFRDVPGLVQKYYSYDQATQEWAGIYLWESEEALAAFLESDLRRSIPEAYELTEPPVIQRFPVIDVLRP